MCFMKGSNKNIKKSQRFLIRKIILMLILIFGFTGYIFVDVICYAGSSTKPLANTNTEASSLLFPDELARFSTPFSVNDSINRNRAFNMKLVCSKINGKVVKAGENFSFNTATGPRTDDLGYKPAWIYVNGKMVQDTGGGVCQVSSTLYNAVLLADLQIVERKNHQFTVTYVKKGLDATVFYGSQDFIFKNTTNAPLKIECNVSSSNRLTFIIKGKREKTSKTVSYESRIVKTLPYSTTVQYDAALEEGKKVNSGHSGQNGYIVEVFKVYTDKITGKKLSRIKLYTDSYKPYNSVVVEGTKKIAMPTVSPKPSVGPQPTETPTETPSPTLKPTEKPTPTAEPTPEIEPTATPDIEPTAPPTPVDSGLE